MIESPWSIIRAFSSTAGESTSAPASTDFTVALPSKAPFVEIGGTGLSTSGSPTSITFTCYMLASGIVQKLGSFDVLLADIGNFAPKIFEFNASKVYVKVSFTGGTSPAITGSLIARPVFAV